METGTKLDGFELFDPLIEIQKRISQTESKLERLYSLFAEGDSDVLLGVISETQKSLNSLKAEYQAEEQNQSSTKQLALVKAQIASIKETWPLLSDQQKQAMIRDCVSKIIVTSEKIQIYYTFKTSEKEAKSA